MLDATDSVVLVRERREFGEIPYTDNSASVQLSGSRKMNDKFWPVFVATLVAALGPLNFGFALGFTSPVEAAMEDKSQKLCLTKGQFSWFAVSSYFTIHHCCNYRCAGPGAEAYTPNTHLHRRPRPRVKGAKSVHFRVFLLTIYPLPTF